jgi:hypothetical protein
VILLGSDVFRTSWTEFVVLTGVSSLEYKRNSESHKALANNFLILFFSHAVWYLMLVENIDKLNICSFSCFGANFIDS